MNLKYLSSLSGKTAALRSHAARNLAVLSLTATFATTFGLAGAPFAQAMSPPYCAAFSEPDLQGSLAMLYPNVPVPRVADQVKSVASAWVDQGFVIDTYSEPDFAGVKNTIAAPTEADARYKHNGRGYYINLIDLSPLPVQSMLCHQG